MTMPTATSTTAASGLTETRRYDSRGRLVSLRQTGDGTTRETRYVYNNADQLRMVEDAQGGRRYRFYDAAGRLAYAVDATGAVTRSEYNRDRADRPANTISEPRRHQ